MMWEGFDPRAAGWKLCMRIKRLWSGFVLSLWPFGSAIAKLIRFKTSCLLSNSDGGWDDTRTYPSKVSGRACDISRRHAILYDEDRVRV